MSATASAGWDAPPRRLGGGHHARVWEIAGPGGPLVVKVGDADLLAHEARVLTDLAGAELAPDLIAAGDGVLVTGRLPGAPRPPGEWDVDAAHALGALVARAHARCGPVYWEHPARPAKPLTPAEYDAAWTEAICQGVPPAWAEVARRAADRLPPPDPDGPVSLHGDLWSGNVVWGPTGPRLVDWEYARPGDRAEDLAYLAAMDDLDAPLMDALLTGYGADAPLRRRVARGRAAMAVWCAAWFAAHQDARRAAALFAQAERELRLPGA